MERSLQAILFSPRGGSAHLTRALTRELRGRGREMALLAGSRTDLGGLGDARTFYGDWVHAVDFTAALRSGDPMHFAGPPGTAPMHPSYEDRADAPDLAFPRLGDAELEAQVAAWSRELTRAGASGAEVLYLHHLTPLNEAAARAAPHVPVVGHLHGTELLMLERIENGPPPAWIHAQAWAERLRGWANACARLLVAPGGAERAAGLLGVARERLVEVSSGVDLELFAPREIERRAFWQSVFPERSPASLPSGCVLLYVGRFTAVKRLDLLVRAFARASGDARTQASLVLVGGHPGELEGEHPLELAERLGVERVFHAGWRSHEELAPLFLAADAVVLASEREAFGQVLAEGMASGLPAVATRSPGPEAIVSHGETGWLADSSEVALACALVEVIDSPAERRRRGLAARVSVANRFSWRGVGERVDRVLGEAARPGGDEFDALAA